MAGKMCSDDEEMMYCAGLLLELPQLVYLSEFRDAWKQGNWISTKKRSGRKIRRAFVDFNCCTPLMPRLGSSSYSECCAPNNMNEKKGGGHVAGKKRKRTNPNPNTQIKKTTTLSRVKFRLGPHSEKDSSSSSSGMPNEELLNVGGGAGNGIVVAKKNPSQDALTIATTELPPQAKKQKSSLKVTFKLIGHTNIVGQKQNDSSISAGSGSDVSDAELLSEAPASNAIEYPDKGDQTEPPVLVDNNIDIANQDSSSSDVNKHMTKPLIPDLNIPLNMTEEHPLPHPTVSSLLPLLASASHQPPMLLQNNGSWGGPCPSLHNMNIHGYIASSDRAAAAKEKRMMRMKKL